MITNADMILDTHGRPILVLQEHLPEGETVLTLNNAGFEISVDGEKKAVLEKIEPEILTTIGLQNKVGISVHDGGHLLPDTIEYVADVHKNLTID